jgi:hypothetical protein
MSRRGLSSILSHPAGVYVPSSQALSDRRIRKKGKGRKEGKDRIEASERVREDTR